MSHIMESNLFSSQVFEAYDKVKQHPLYYLPYFLNDFEYFLCDKSCNGVNFEFQYDYITLHLKLLVLLYAEDTVFWYK